MTRIMRMRVPVGERKEWISLLPGGKPDTHRAIAQNGEEFEFTDNKKDSLEIQIGKILAKRQTAGSE
ncbi:MAG: hypothetical protein V3S94_05815 [Gammaproteobacteria bacterium]